MLKPVKIHFDEHQRKKINNYIDDIFNTGQLASAKYVEEFEKQWA